MSDWIPPHVAGRRIRGSNNNFERACLVHIERLQHGLGDYDGAMLDTFCEAVRLVREYNDSITPQPPTETYRELFGGQPIAPPTETNHLPSEPHRSP